TGCAARPKSRRVFQRVLRPDLMIWEYILRVAFSGLSLKASVAVAAHTCSLFGEECVSCRLPRSIYRLLQLIAIRPSHSTRTVRGISLKWHGSTKGRRRASPRRSRHERRALWPFARQTPKCWTCRQKG